MMIKFIGGNIPQQLTYWLIDVNFDGGIQKPSQFTRGGNE